MWGRTREVHCSCLSRAHPRGVDAAFGNAYLRARIARSRWASGVVGAARGFERRHW